jgi:hypothetical protein
VIASKAHSVVKLPAHTFTGGIAMSETKAGSGPGVRSPDAPARVVLQKEAGRNQTCAPMGAAREEPIVVFLTRGKDTASVNAPVWGVVPHQMRVDEEWVVKIDGTLWRARVAALRLKAESTAHFPEGCQLVDFKLLRRKPPNA